MVQSEDHLQNLSAKYSLCNSQRPTTAHVLSSCPIALNQSWYTYHHDKVLFILATKLTELFAGIIFVPAFADLPN